MRFLDSRRSLSVFLALAACGFVVVGCSEQGVASQDENAPIRIETTQMYVTVRNQSGMALNDVSVAIVPVGRTTIYNKYLGRLENEASRNVMLGDFVGRDGTPFSLRVVKPRSIQVKGNDVGGKKYDVEVGWK